jgi:uncharacterized protein YjbI with pentapeptide repeats
VPGTPGKAETSISPASSSTAGTSPRQYSPEGRLAFTGAEFSGGQVDFRGAKFSGGQADFRDAVFSRGEANFADAEFSGAGEVRFTRVEFSGGKVDFLGAEFSGLCCAKTRSWPLTWRFALARPPCGIR